MPMFNRAPDRPRVVIITGATAGVGRALAHRFARAGDRIGLIARDVASLEQVRQELQSSGTEVAAEPVDVQMPTRCLLRRSASSRS